MGAIVHLNNSVAAWLMSRFPKKFFNGQTLSVASPLIEAQKCRKINFSRKKALAAVCPDSFVGCDWLLTIHGGCGWRRHRGALSLRGSNAGIWRDLHGPLRDENSQWDEKPESGTRIENKDKIQDQVQGSGANGPLKSGFTWRRETPWLHYFGKLVGLPALPPGCTFSLFSTKCV